MQEKALVKNIKIVKNNTKPIGEIFFPNIDYTERSLDLSTNNQVRYTKISSRIPVIRGDVYMILLTQRYEDNIKTPNRKKEYIQRFLQDAFSIQQRYIVQDNLMVVDAFNQEQVIYKMEY